MKYLKRYGKNTNWKVSPDCVFIRHIFIDENSSGSLELDADNLAKVQNNFAKQDTFIKDYLSKKGGSHFPVCREDSKKPIVFRIPWNNIFCIPIARFEGKNKKFIIVEQPMANLVWLVSMDSWPAQINPESDPLISWGEASLLCVTESGWNDDDFSTVIEI